MNKRLFENITTKKMPGILTIYFNDMCTSYSNTLIQNKQFSNKKVLMREIQEAYRPRCILSRLMERGALPCPKTWLEYPHSPGQDQDWASLLLTPERTLDQRPGVIWVPPPPPLCGQTHLWKQQFSHPSDVGGKQKLVNTYFQR